MTDEPWSAAEIKRLRALCDAATPGEWLADLHHTRTDAGRTYGFIFAKDIVPLAAITLGVEGMPQDEGRANAAFIAAARTGLSRALDQIEALEHELEALNASKGY